MKNSTSRMTSLQIALRGLPALLALAAVAAVLPAQTGAPTAGEIAVVVPVAKVVRSQPQAQSLEAKRGMPIQWNDSVETERGGRVRIRLTDGSVLNVGSQSKLVVLKHDAQEQSTELDLLYGRIRSNATRIVKPNGQFKVKTRAATAGVVGTEKYVEASAVETTVIAMGGGNVTVSSNDARYPDPILLVPGEAVTMAVGRPPGQKRPASAEEMSRAAAETESDPVVQLSPNQAAPGSRLEATITGRGLDTATAFSFAQPGIQIATRGAASGGSVPVTITVADGVAPGSYAFTVTRPTGSSSGTLVVTARQAAGAVPSVTLPGSIGLSGAIRGAKIPLDASGIQPPPGSQIVRTEWRVVNTQIRSNEAIFTLNTSLLSPGNYNVELSVTTDRGQTATQRYPLTIQAGTQPAEILRNLATAYESLQPTAFLRYFDDQKFRNYGGFAGAIEDSFRNQLETMRVFQRAVNCQVVEEQDQAICQADLELRFTKKDQALQLLDPSGNPVPSGTTAPPGSTLGKAVQVGFERTTLRFERADQGWRIVDYGAVVSCPGGASATGISVGSCVLAVASGSTPSFQLVNLQLSSSSISLGGTVQGSIEVQSLAGYGGQVNLTGQAQVGGQPFTVSFNANPATPGAPVGFTLNAPTSAPAGFSGPTSFTLVITGQDTAGSITASINAPMVLQPGYTLAVTPVTTGGAPLSVTHNSSTNLQVTVSGGSGFTGSVLVDFPNLPAGFQAAPGNVLAGSTVSFPLTVTNAAAPGPALITVRGASATSLVQTVAVFTVVASDFTLTASSPTNFITSPGGSLTINVNVVPISGFAGSVLVDFQGLPVGLTPVPASALVPAGGSTSFNVGVGAAVPIGGIAFNVRGTFLSAVRTLAIAGNVQSAPPPITGSGTTMTRSVIGSTAPPPSGTKPTGAASAPPAAIDPLTGNPITSAPATTLAASGSASNPPTGSAGAPTAAVKVERARVRVEAGTCIGFRFASAGETPCGGTADFEMKTTADGNVTLEAEGLASAGVVGVDQYRAATSAPSLSRTMAAQTGATYVVQSRNTLYVVKVTFGRPMGGTRGRVGGVRSGDTQGSTGGASMVISLEWRALP